MKVLQEEVSKNILFFRNKKGISRKELAEKINVTVASVSHWENARNSMDMDTLYKICNVLNVSITDMFGKFATQSGECYSSEEKNIIYKVRKLNENGKNYVVKQVNYALQQDEYIIKEENSKDAW